MIFVTVGTSDFDLLVETIDELAPTLGEEVVIQIGRGDYIPRNCEHFRYAPSLAPYYDKANIVISQGGMGTTFEVLERGKKLLSVENTTCVDTHQTEILKVLSEEGHLIWCKSMDELAAALEEIRTLDLKPYNPPTCEIAHIVKDFLNQLK
ncbi:MAG: hypothetical protein JW981_08825 [Anaerolineae bacterium]|nr:hypothetical protein [Anaerolineae bacterium]